MEEFPNTALSLSHFHEVYFKSNVFLLTEMTFRTHLYPLFSWVGSSYQWELNWKALQCRDWLSQGTSWGWHNYQLHLFIRLLSLVGWCPHAQSYANEIQSDKLIQLLLYSEGRASLHTVKPLVHQAGAAPWSGSCGPVTSPNCLLRQLGYSAYCWDSGSVLHLSHFTSALLFQEHSWSSKAIWCRRKIPYRSPSLCLTLLQLINLFTLL